MGLRENISRKWATGVRTRLKPACRSSRVRGVVLFVLAFTPALLIAWQIALNGVNVPMWDDWERAALLRRFYEGTLDFQFLASAHIDHRILWPRLIILALNELTGGDLRAEMWFSFAGHIVFALALFALVRQSLGPTRWVYGTTFLVNLWIFHPLQFQNFLWGIQVAFLQPLMALGICLWTMTRERLSLPAKYGICLGAATLGTFSFSHGLFIWPVVFGLGLLLHRFAPNLRARWAFLGAWLVGTAAVIGFYLFWHYENTSNPTHAYWSGEGDTPPALKMLDQTMERLGDTGELFFTFIGSYYGRLTLISTHHLAAWFGGIVFALFLIACGVMLANWKRPALRDALLPWAALGGYAVIGCLAMATGRSWLGMKAGMIPRYGSISLLLSVAVIVMFAVLLRHWRTSASRESGHERTCSNVCTAVAVAVAVIQVPLWIYGVRQMENFKLARLQARASLLYINHFYPDNLHHLDGTFEFPRVQANFLNSRGLLKPALFEKPDFGTFTLKGTLSESRAEIMQLQHFPDGRIEISGFATIEGQGRIADGVLLCRFIGQGDPDDKETSRNPQNWQVLALADMRCVPRTMPERMDYQFTNWEITYGKETWSRWSEILDPDQLPEDLADPTEIYGWVLDTERMETRRIKKPVVLTRELEPATSAAQPPRAMAGS